MVMNIEELIELSLF